MPERFYTLKETMASGSESGFTWIFGFSISAVHGHYGDSGRPLLHVPDTLGREIHALHARSENRRSFASDLVGWVITSYQHRWVGTS
jgi:hypothetical protein